MKKNIAFILAVAIVISAMLGVVSYAEVGDGEPVLDVAWANLEFGNKVYLYVAVDYSAFGSADGVTLKVTNNKTGTVTTYQPNPQITAPANCVAFKCTADNARNMGDELVLQAQKDGIACGEAKVYSILEYALKAQTYGDQKLTDLMQGMIKLGANYQIAYKHEGTYDLSKSWALVISPNATVKKTIAEVGSTLTLTSAEEGKNVLCTAEMKRLGSSTITVEPVCHTYIFASESEISQ